jgi:uncharacterized protein YecE (DUF72 family)
MIQSYHLGCPSWGFKAWVGHLYRLGTRAGDFLGEYAKVFNAVEGNTTFYSVPTAEVVERWREATPEGFRFCFKLPRVVTHERRLESAAAETAEFLDRMAPLDERLGPFMIQLPPSFGPGRLGILDQYLKSLPPEYDYVVELRHRHFYTDETLATVDDLFRERGCGRILLDTRALRGGDPEHPDAGGCNKPDLPVRPPTDPGRYPIVRFISHPDDATNEPWFERWSVILGGWIREGRRPFFFVHCPNDFHAPRLARRFHAALGALADIGEMPPWPGEVMEAAESAQLRLW